LCALVPLLVVPIVGGAIADAVDRRRLLLRTETGLAAVSLLLAGNAVLPHPQVWALYAGEALATAIFSLGTPSLRSLLPRLVAEDQIAAANALEGVYGNLGAVAGPALFGVLVAAIGFPLTYLLDVATFGMSLWSVRRQGLGVCVAAALWGLALVGFGYAGALWLALGMLAVAGAADFVSAVLRSTILLTATPDALRGRLSGIEFAQVASAPSLGNLEAGVVASLTSLRFSVVSGGLACIAGTVVCALALPPFVRYDSRHPDA